MWLRGFHSVPDSLSLATLTGNRFAWIRLSNSNSNLETPRNTTSTSRINFLSGFVTNLKLLCCPTSNASHWYVGLCCCSNLNLINCTNFPNCQCLLNSFLLSINRLNSAANWSIRRLNEFRFCQNWPFWFDGMPKEKIGKLKKNLKKIKKKENNENSPVFPATPVIPDECYRIVKCP